MATSGVREAGLGITRSRIFFTPDADQAAEHAFSIPKSEFREAKLLKDGKVSYLTLVSKVKKNQEFAIGCFGNVHDIDDMFIPILNFAVLASNDFDAGVSEFQRLTASVQPKRSEQEKTLSDLLGTDPNASTTQPLNNGSLTETTTGDASSFFNLGKTHLKLHLYDEAIRAFRQAIQIKPDYSEAYNGLGDAYLYSGKHQDAITAYTQAIRINPNFGEAYNGLGVAYSETYQPEEANPLFDLNKNSSTAPPTAATTQTEAAPGSFDFSKAKFTTLPGTAEEARMLGTILPNAKVFTREQATKGALQKLSGPSILHIATQGFFLADAPDTAAQRTVSRQLVWENNKSQMTPSGIHNPLLRSGLAFAGANTRGTNSADDNGIMTAYETASLDLQGTKLVVLSACDTGVGEVKVGEGVYGLRRALVIAGAESQVTSLWQVDDVATRDLMVDYYKRLQKGEGRGEALRNAQLSMLKSADRSHPYYWASFIQIGDWSKLQVDMPMSSLER